jgi:hypothetical protein
MQVWTLLEATGSYWSRDRALKEKDQEIKLWKLLEATGHMIGY